MRNEICIIDPPDRTRGYLNKGNMGELYRQLRRYLIDEDKRDRSLINVHGSLRISEDKADDEFRRSPRKERNFFDVIKHRNTPNNSHSTA